MAIDRCQGAIFCGADSSGVARYETNDNGMGWDGRGRRATV